MHDCEYGCDTPYEELVVFIEEVTHAIEKLDLNKACGSDGICSEHLKYASNVLVPLLAMCFTSFISHGFLPKSMLSVMLVPVIKDKAGKISSKDNYRPIALASVISKLVEVIMLDRIEMYMITNPNQFGFKRKHGTDQCIYVLKEIIDLYRRLNGSGSSVVECRTRNQGSPGSNPSLLPFRRLGIFVLSIDAPVDSAV